MIRPTDRWSIDAGKADGSEGRVAYTHPGSLPDGSRLMQGKLMLDGEVVGKPLLFRGFIIAQFELPQGFLLVYDTCDGETFDPFMNIPLIQGRSDIYFALYSRDGRLIEGWDWGSGWMRPTKQWSMHKLVSRRVSAYECYYIIDHRRIAFKPRDKPWQLLFIHDCPIKVRRRNLMRRITEIDNFDKLQYADQSAFLPKKVGHLHLAFSRNHYTHRQYWWIKFWGWGYRFWPMWPFTDSIPKHVKKYEKPYLESQPFPPPLPAYDGPLSSEGLPWGFELWWARKKQRLKQLLRRK